MGAPSKGLSNTSVVAVGVALALSTLLAAVALQRQGAPIAAALAQRGGCPPPAAATAATAAAPPLPTCGIALGGNPRWAYRCDLLADVCVDQGAFVLQGQQYRPVPGRPAALLPALRTPLGGVKYVPPWTGDKVADLQMEVEVGAAGQGRAAPACRPPPQRSLPAMPPTRVPPRLRTSPSPAPSYLPHPHLTSTTLTLTTTPTCRPGAPTSHSSRCRGCERRARARAPLTWRAPPSPPAPCRSCGCPTGRRTFTTRT